MYSTLRPVAPALSRLSSWRVVLAAVLLALAAGAASCQAQVTAPGTPTGLSAAAGTSQISLNWNPVTNNTAYVANIDNSGTYTPGPGYGPYPSFTVQRIAAGADGLLRVLWIKSDNSIALWLMNSDNGQWSQYLLQL